MKITLLALISTLLLSCFSAGAAIAGPGEDDYLTGLYLEYRSDGPPDYQSAWRHYQAAAQAGSREARLALARLSDPTGPLKMNPAQWLNNLKAAAKAGWPEAAYTLAGALEQGLLTAPDLKFSDYYYQAALSGHPQAALRLGELYLEQAMETEGAMWLTIAAENHEARAPLRLGRLYMEKNPQAALHWLEKSDQPEALYLLGELYLNENRFVEAINAFTASADQHYPQAHQALGLIMLDNDFGIRPNPREALKHLKVAAQAGLPEGEYQLARMYLSGQATPKDTITGAYWLYRAGLAGHAKAHEEYEKLTYNFTVGQKKRLDRMIAEGQAD